MPEQTNSAFVDGKYFADVLKWNEEFKRIQKEIND